jgi:hypothetical protein
MNDNAIEQGTSAWPIDEIVPREGKVRIAGSYVQPNLNLQVFVFGLVLWWPLLILALWSEVFSAESELPAMGVVSIVTVGIALLVRSLLMGKLDLKVGAETVEIGRKKYSRDERIDFSVEDHHKAILEQQKNPGSRKWRDAIEVIMRYGERRVTIAEMRKCDEEMAISLVLRLQQWCRKFDLAKVSFGQGEEGAAPQVPSEFGKPPDVV